MLTVILLHNFLRRRPNSTALYMSQGTFDSEEAGIVTPGNWRAANNEIGSLFLFRRIIRQTRTRLLNTREELADYFSKEEEL